MTMIIDDGPTVEIPAVPPAAPLSPRGVVLAMKKAVHRRAIQFTGDNWAEIVFFTGGDFLPVLPCDFTDPKVAASAQAWIDDTGNYCDSYADPDIVAVVYDKMHGWIPMRTGDWVLEGDEGEHYPMTNARWAQRMDIIGEDK